MTVAGAAVRAPGTNHAPSDRPSDVVTSNVSAAGHAGVGRRQHGPEREIHEATAARPRAAPGGSRAAIRDADARARAQQRERMTAGAQSRRLAAPTQEAPIRRPSSSSFGRLVAKSSKSSARLASISLLVEVRHAPAAPDLDRALGAAVAAALGRSAAPALRRRRRPEVPLAPRRRVAGRRRRRGTARRRRAPTAARPGPSAAWARALPGDAPR
ncbi:MAG: hypothetical protein MZV64_73225 [Ignavibacteriales bacterium]|nr:hypothetical protein [Ignavibacteriales bacterium]